MEPTLMVVGLNHRIAPLAMRERFWIGENRRYEVLRQLQSADGIDEVAVLCTRCRTEFLVWANEPTLAANSLLQFLSSYGLKLTEWQHFYRLLDATALAHIFRVTAGLDSLFLGEPQVAAQVEAAWQQAGTVGSAGPFLNSVLTRALEISKKVRSDTAIGKLAVSIPTAALELARQIFGTLENRRVLLLGTDEMCELSVRHIIAHGAGSVVVIDQSPARAQELAKKLGGTSATIADRWKYMLKADIVIAATGCPHVVLTHDEAERIARERNRVALVIMDIGMPRDVDPDVRRVDGIMLYDLEGLERAVQQRTEDRMAASEEAERTVATQAQEFWSKMQAQTSVPTTVALRNRLDEICRQELESFIRERGPFNREQDQLLHAVTAHVIHKIAGSLARELKDLPEKEEQEQMTKAVTRLFHLESPQKAIAGTRSKQEENERKKQTAIAINY
ncbi:MAG TPA: glutamyl-tRNA reductase [Candidatus Sulfotelmatobacter sp.]|nr:glutamyl-tRNA reductase [Candidatus Sulfotelmatobacter sp.]